MALNIMDALERRIEEILKDFPLVLEVNDLTPFKVFRHKIPERLNKKLDYSKKDTHNDVYPFCVLKIDTGSKESNESLEDTVFNIAIGVKNEGHNGEGYDDVMACIRAIWNDFNANPILGGFFRFKYPLNWVLDDSDEQLHPFYYGAIQIRFESHSIMKVGGHEIGR